jgi:FkbM family methyltransferase
MRGGYEVAERSIVSRMVSQGDIVIELGASVGVLTSLLVLMVGGGGKVVAVEPNRHLHRHFERQLACNGVSATLVSALACPIWDGCVPSEFKLQTFSACDDSLSGRAATELGDVVPWVTLRDLAAQVGIENPTTLVVDVEGSERVWCDFAPNFPASVKTVIVEIHPRIIGEEAAAQCLVALMREGFVLQMVSGSVFGFTR